MAMLCRCPDCGQVLDARKSDHGELCCPDCKGWFWIPRSVFDAAPFAKRIRNGRSIIGVSFDISDGYTVTYKDAYGQFRTGRSYDPFTGYWRGEQDGIDDFSHRRR